MEKPIFNNFRDGSEGFINWGKYSAAMDQAYNIINKMLDIAIDEIINLSDEPITKDEVYISLEAEVRKANYDTE